MENISTLVRAAIIGIGLSALDAKAAESPGQLPEKKLTHDVMYALAKEEDIIAEMIGYSKQNSRLDKHHAKNQRRHTPTERAGYPWLRPVMQIYS